MDKDLTQAKVENDQVKIHFKMKFKSLNSRDHMGRKVI